VKAVYSSLNLLEAHHLKNVLTAAGIRCRMKNEELVRLAGEIPFPECALQVLVERTEDYPAAEALVRDFLKPRPQASPSWRCSRCGETSEGQFTACWNCGGDRR
jgi:lipopolysaccharide biosynthesis regulator YciM